MMKGKNFWFIVGIMSAALAGPCPIRAETVLPVFNPGDFVAGAAIDNQYLPMTPGILSVYGGEVEDDGTIVYELGHVFVTFETKTILGVVCTVVQDTEWSDGELKEQTSDWYAQDESGNVWYFGEAVDIYEEGQVVSHDGSWEAGVDGALPGYVMKAQPLVQDPPYYQEFYEGEAEDTAQVLSLVESVSVEYGDFENCLQTLEWTPLDDPLIYEHKFYAAGVGLVQVDNLDDDSSIELLSMTYVPEPATILVMGLGGLSLLLKRRA